jgi:hypothetical protein
MLEPPPAQVFFRVYDMGGGVLLPIGIRGGTVQAFRLLGDQGTHYFIETTTNLGAPQSWIPVMNFTLTNSWQSFD